MDQQRALEIVQSLASGVDPFTEKAFRSDSLLQNPDVVRALFTAAAALQSNEPKGPKPKAAKDAALPSAAGKPWSKAEDDQLVKSFDGGVGEKELAVRHQRTHNAIRARLVKLGKLDPAAYEPRRPAGPPAISEPRAAH